MDEGILLLRVLLGPVLLVHAAQKFLGWFRGHLAAQRRFLPEHPEGR